MWYFFTFFESLQDSGYPINIRWHDSLFSHKYCAVHGRKVNLMGYFFSYSLLLCIYSILKFSTSSFTDLLFAVFKILLEIWLAFLNTHIYFNYLFLISPLSVLSLFSDIYLISLCIFNILFVFFGILLKICNSQFSFPFDTS